MGKVDEIKALDLSAVDLVEQWTGKRPKGPDAEGRHLALCIAHDDKHESMRLFPGGGFKCFSCEATGGDVIDLWAAHHSITKSEAIRSMHRELVGPGVNIPASAPSVRARRPELKTQPREKMPARPFPPEEIPRAGNTSQLHRPDGSPSMVTPKAVYPYRDEKGRVFHCILRVEKGTERKVFIPARWDGAKLWMLAQDTPRRLYGIEQLAGCQQVLLVEGEKAADAARKRLPVYIAVLTWPGGASAAGVIDWSPLYGRPLVMWPDNDAPGRTAMDRIGKAVAGECTEIKLVDPPSELPKGWDAADLDPKLDMLDWLREHVGPWLSHDEAAEVELQEEAQAEIEAVEAIAPLIVPDVFSSPEEVKAKRTAAFPFHILGQSDGRAYFLKRPDGRMVDMPMSQLCKRDQLGILARPDLWQKAFGGTEVNAMGEMKPVHWTTIAFAAQSHIVEACEQLPEFNPDRTRGRGCWPHKSTVAFNRGDLVEIGGELAEENYIDGIVYERGTPLPVEKERQLSDEEGKQLFEILDKCCWRDEHGATAMAGWIALAPICGALSWRPHVWITGPTGSGKSTIANDIVWPAIGRSLCVRVAGNTSEAGLRQIIKRDALPIILDEMESDAKSMLSILDLARSASTGDTVVRGSTSGAAQIYHVRSTFCFASINPAISKAADESRITRLELIRARGADADEQYLKMRNEIADLITDEFGSRLAARMVSIAESVLKNIEVVENAITRRFGSRRLAQQWGALLAGYYALTSREELLDTEADGLAGLVPAETVRVQLTEDDAFNMVTQLCGHMLNVTVPSGHEMMPVSELISRLATIASHEDVARLPRESAEDALERAGMKVVDMEFDDKTVKGVAIARKHLGMMRIFWGTPWQSSYYERFKDIEGTVAAQQRRYSGKRYTTAVVPVDFFMGDTGGKE